MTHPFATEIPRDRWGRPLVVPPDQTTKTVPYTRMTTHVSATEDTWALEKWKMRMTALGVVEREDIHLAIAAHRDDKEHLNRLCDQAVEAAKASAGATKGTALHALLDQWDRGQLDLNKVPAAYRKDIEAYARATEHLEVVEIETFGVLDTFQVAGTWDRLYRTRTGRLVIGDTKTGSIEYGMGKIAGQLAGYSRATPYNHTTRTRATPNPDRGVDQEFGIVMHLPAGQGVCELVEVNLTAGWEGFLLATEVRKWRTRKGLHRPFVDERPIDTDLLVEIRQAATESELRLLWASNHATRWTDEHTAAAAARKAELRAALART